MKSKKILNKKTVAYIRSTSIINDSRATKEITTLINNGYGVIVFGWDRDGQIDDNKLVINNKEIRSSFFKHTAPYGKSLNTIYGLLRFYFWIISSLKKNISQFSIVHACDFDCGYPAYKIIKKFQKEFIYDMYDYYSDSRPLPSIIKSWIINKENEIINNADVSIICGEWRKDQIAGTTPKQLVVIHNTPNLLVASNSKIIKSNSNKLKVCYVGILQNNRLIKETLEEFKNNNNYELHIGGFGIFDTLLEKASKQYNNVFYYGSLKYDEVLALEKDCDVLFAIYNPAIKNHKYSAPNKVYEAMALGKPIVVCENTGIDKLVSKNNIGFVIKYDAKDLIRILDKLNSDKTLLTKISKQANKTYTNKYSWTIMENKLISAYAELNC